MNDCKVAPLLPNHDYRASVRACNAFGCSKWSDFPTLCQTDFGPPDPIPRPEATIESNGTVIRVHVLERADERWVIELN